MGFWDSGLFHPGRWGDDAANAFGIDSHDPTNADRAQLEGVGFGANAFAGTTAANYGQQNQALNNTYGNMAQTQDYLRGQMMGQNSVSAEQLRQGQQSNIAAQRSLAASAAPQNSAMAARTAANNTAKLGYGMSGQQATAGLQERNQAAQNLASSQQGMGQLQATARGQDANATNGAYGVAGTAYGNTIQNGQKYGISGAMGGGAGGFASLFSDERLKKNIKGADADSKQTLGKLNAYRFDYKDEKHGKGNQLGVMAQELEKAGLGHVIEEKSEGKAVNTGRLSLANTAMLASIHKRLSAVEDK